MFKKTLTRTMAVIVVASFVLSYPLQLFAETEIATTEWGSETRGPRRGAESFTPVSISSAVATAENTQETATVTPTVVPETAATAATVSSATTETVLPITATTIAEAAENITTTYNTDATKAQAVFDFVQDNVTYENYSGSQYGAEGTLQAGKGNGYDQALLTGTLCEASGLNVQYKEVVATDVRGMGIDKDSTKRIYAEVKVDGEWKAIDTADKRNTQVGDLAINVTSVSATYASLNAAKTVNVTSETSATDTAETQVSATTQGTKNLETSGFQINASATYEEMAAAIENGEFKLDQPIYLVSDNMRGTSADKKYLNEIKAKLEAVGAHVTVMDIGPGANLEVYDVAPENAVVVSLGGVDAWKVYEFGTNWFKNVMRKDNELLFVNLGKTDLSTNPTLQRAHDDNYSPSWFTSLEDPLSYLIANDVQLNQSDLNWIYNKDSAVDGVSDIAAQALQMAGKMTSYSSSNTVSVPHSNEGVVDNSAKTTDQTSGNAVTGTTILEVAQNITANHSTDAAKAQAVFDFVRDNIAYANYSGSQYGAEGTLQAGKGNGFDQALLVETLCNSVGLQAQLKQVTATNVRGMGIDKDSTSRIYAEVKVDGSWKAIDTADTRNSKVGDLNINVTSIAATFTKYGSSSNIIVSRYEGLDTTEEQTVANNADNASQTSTIDQNSPYLQPSSHCQSNDPTIIQKANEITQGLTSDYDKAKAIFDWVNDNKDIPTTITQNREQ